MSQTQATKRSESSVVCSDIEEKVADMSAERFVIAVLEILVRQGKTTELKRVQDEAQGVAALHPSTALMLVRSLHQLGYVKLTPSKKTNEDGKPEKWWISPIAHRTRRALKAYRFMAG